MEIALKYIVKDTFTQKQILGIPQKLLDQKFSLNIIDDTQGFIKKCENETKHFKIAGEHRINDWEKGWSGDGVFYSDNKNIDNLPYYFKNNTHIRVGGKLYEDLSGFSEVYLSGCGKSRHAPMKQIPLFDSLLPTLSLYVEAKK